MLIVELVWLSEDRPMGVGASTSLGCLRSWWVRTERGVKETDGWMVWFSLPRIVHFQRSAV